MQLDGGALGFEAEAGLSLLVGADAVVGDEGPACTCDRTTLPCWTTIPTLARRLGPVHPLQTDVCIVIEHAEGEPECLKVRDDAPAGEVALLPHAIRLAPVRTEAN